MNAAAFDATVSSRDGFHSSVFYFSIFIIAMATTVDFAQAEGIVTPSLNSPAQVSITDPYGGGFVIPTIGQQALSVAKTAAEEHASQMQANVQWGLHVSDVNPSSTWTLTLVKPVHQSLLYFGGIFQGVQFFSYTQPAPE